MGPVGTFLVDFLLIGMSATSKRERGVADVWAASRFRCPNPHESPGNSAGLIHTRPLIAVRSPTTSRDGVIIAAASPPRRPGLRRRGRRPTLSRVDIASEILAWSETRPVAVVVGAIAVRLLRPEIGWLGCAALPEACIAGASPAAVALEASSG
jgi:hypothetical protein